MGEAATDGAGDEAEPEYGFPARAWRAVAERPPRVLRRVRWRSPLRGPWLTSVFALVLLAGLPVVILTGLLSYLAYSPQFDQAYPTGVGLLRLPQFDWPTRPSWLYRLNQGLHVELGLVLVPVVLAKLWSVVPKLVEWPPARSIAQVLERLSLLMLVGGILFEMATGVLNIQYDYVFGFSFYTAHYYGAWVFIAGFVAHVSLKLRTMLTAVSSRSWRMLLGDSRAQTRPETDDLGTGLVADDPAPASMSRRGALTVVGGGSLLVLGLTAGQTVGGPTRPTALLLPRGRNPGEGPNGFQINKTAEAAAISDQDLAAWRLTLTAAGRSVTLTRADLLAMEQHTARLPIACVEGWSTTQTWTGVRLRDLAELVRADRTGPAHVESLQRSGAFRQATLQANQVQDADSLLALRVNAVDLAPDHGYPARVIVPALPGVHCTKWVASIAFGGA